MKTKAELMRANRANKKKDGLVELRLWLNPDHKDMVTNYVSRIKREHKSRRAQ